ncbi:RNA polymerase sigma-70 factor (ECF subfamily) [Litorivivens lipolytica]|uniref:RNA polymerase sigma-70 factor (ECF subfamily) n=1 Tax=Litorivivens lipolytica TaxID=1524264 RepID=A0A7W4W4F9_9GAMM|nr:RNA polymerase sigma factor [Litorivivens lipolytica]MBB3047286.1 RNA polymerase sigma-70 factor (ECF subfamily) [Litorivivens lipolytica]
MTSELSTLRALQSGDPTAFSELVREHHRALLATASAIVGIDNAEECLQNAWIKAHQALPQFEGKSSLRTWLTRIVINESRMLLRKTRREVPLELDESQHPLADRFREGGHWSKPPATWHDESPDGLLMERELADCLSRVLTAMPAQQRAMLELRDVSGLDFDEICNELAVTASNARVLLHRARTQLFRLVDHYQETGEC